MYLCDQLIDSRVQFGPREGGRECLVDYGLTRRNEILTTLVINVYLDQD